MSYNEQGDLHTSCWLTKQWSIIKEILDHTIWSILPMKRKKSCIRGNVRNQLEPPRRIPFHSLSHKGDFSFCLSFSFELFCNRFYLCLIRSGSFCKMPLKMNYWWIIFFLLLWILVPQKNCIFLTALSFTSIFLNTFSMHLGARKVALRFWWPQNTGKLKKKKMSFSGEDIAQSLY